MSGLVASAHNPVRMSLAPRLVAKDRVASVVSLSAINFNLSRIIGPMIAGWMIATSGVQSTLLLQASFYLPFLVIIPSLAVRPRPKVEEANTSYIAALVEGLRYVRNSHLVLQALLFSAIVSFVVRGTLEILPVLADGVYSKGAAGLGLLTSAAGAGAIAASLIKATAPPQRSGELPMMINICAWLGIALVPFLVFVPFWEAALFFVAMFGFTSTIIGISAQTAIQQDLPDDLRGRVMSIWIMVTIGAAAAGAGFIGAASDLFGINPTLIGLGSAGLVILGVILLRTRRL
jgi:predicted MFS family arabinose efflux permease